MKEEERLYSLYSIDVTCPFCGATGFFKITVLSEKIAGATNLVVECPFCEASCSIVANQEKRLLKFVWKVPTDVGI
jgi:transcription elongation factor Elf1